MTVQGQKKERFMSNGKRTVITARIMLVTCTLFVGLAGAADKDWNNGANNLSWDTTSANWNGATWSEGDNAFFTNANASAKGQIELNGTRQVRNITVSQNGYSFTGGALQNAAADQTRGQGWLRSRQPLSGWFPS
jgi:hypothetical protein